MRVKLGGGLNRWEWKYATIVIHIKEYQEQFTLSTESRSKDKKKVHSNTKCGHENKLGHRATELQPNRMCPPAAHGPASARFYKTPYLSKFVEVQIGN